MTTIDKNKLKIHASRNITKILDKLGVQYSKTGGLIQCRCPAKHHPGDGDNNKAFSWRDDYQRWVCWSHHCEEAFGGDVIGLVRSVLEMTFNEAKEWIIETLSSEDLTEDVEDTGYYSRKSDSVYIHKPVEESQLAFLGIDKPPRYMIDRGIPESILRDYEVGYWNKLGTYMHHRIIFPVRDHEGMLIGFTGRSIYDDVTREKNDIAKWLHGRYYTRYSGELKTTSVLYNLFRAKEKLVKSTIILVEGPIDGLKFQAAGIENWAAVLGSSFHPAHRSLLIRAGVNRIITAFDPDKAGEGAHNRVKKVVGDLILVEKFPNLEDDPGATDVDKLIKEYREII